MIHRCQILKADLKHYQLIVKALLIPKEQEDDHHRRANQVVVKIVFEQTEARQESCLETEQANS